MNSDNSDADCFDIQCKSGGGGNTAARSGRQRKGAATGAGAFKANARPPRQTSFTTTDRRSRTRGIAAARRALNTTTGGRLGGTTSRARVTRTAI